MNAWHGFALTVVAQITAITLVAGAAMVCMRRQAAVRHAVGVVALGFVLASPLVTLGLPRGVWFSRGTVADGATASVATEAEAAVVRETQPAVAAAKMDVIEEVANDLPRPIVKPVVSDAVPRSAPLAEPSSAALPAATEGWWKWFSADGETWLLRALNIAAAVWLVGSIVAARRLLARRKVIHQLRDSWELGTFHSAAAEEARRALGVARLPPIAVSDIAPMPLVVGCRQPVVVLPRWLVATASTARLRDVLIHECAHILRGDTWIHAAQQWAGVVYWPHPGVHWLNRELNRAREEVCDNFVLGRSDGADYCQTLLELAESCGSARYALSLLGLFSRRWSLEQRVAGILNPRRNKMTRVSRLVPMMAAVCIAAMSLAIGGVGAWAQTAGEKEPAAGKVEGKPVAKAKKIRVNGLCQNQHSEPIAGARVRVFRQKAYSDPLELVADVRTDEDGKYSVPDVETLRDASDRGGMTDLIVVATATGHASASNALKDIAEGWSSLVLADNPSKLSGVVTDEQGQPLAGVAVFLPIYGSDPIDGFVSSVTDEQGRYAIGDLKSWNPKDTETFDPKTGITTVCTGCNFSLQHPDYALTRATYTAIPQEVNVKMQPPAIVEGRVIDQVTGQPLTNVEVAAQGVTDHGWYTTRTDERGHYRFLMTKDYYNVWAEADDRMPIALKALLAEPGKSVKDADIPMVRGGYVVGSILDRFSGQPIRVPLGSEMRVAHYGPARPTTGAAVTSTLVKPDGSFRLHVAPGRNYVYTMDDQGTASAYVDVKDGEEVKLDLRAGEQVSENERLRDPDLKLRQRLYRQAQREKDDQEKIARGEKPSPPSRKRSNTPIGKLLDELEDQNHGSELFKDPWLETLKSIVDLGPEAVPELIEELDATEDNMMLRCIGFTLRAINDKRAVPALIRAIPKTLRERGSDMGCRAEGEELAKFAQKHDLDRPDEGKEYGFGRPVREIIGALRKLTGKKFDELQLFDISYEGTAAQKRMKRKIFDRTAKTWAQWWDGNAKDFVEDVAYWKVNLPEPPAEEAGGPLPGGRYKTTGGGSNWILQSVFNAKARTVFYDFDTGRTAALPKKWRGDKELEKRMHEIVAWAAEEGYDMMGTEYVAAGGRKYFALRNLGMKAWELPAEDWKKEYDTFTVEEQQKRGVAATGELLLHFDPDKKSYAPEAIAPFFCITREGTPGLIYVGIEVQDDSLKPGGISMGDDELDPVAFYKGRRFGYSEFEEVK